MTKKDVPEVVNSDILVFGHTLGMETIINEIDQNPLAHYFVMRTQKSGELIGHLSFWIDRTNAQILNFYILPKYQGRRYGRLLLEFGLDHMMRQGVDTITLEVRVSNQKAIMIYDKFGFSRVAIRKQYYDNGEDAILMLKKCEVMNDDSHGRRDQL